MYPFNIAFSGDFITNLMSNTEDKEKEKITYNNNY